VENAEYKLDEYAIELFRITCSELNSIYESIIKEETINKSQIEIKNINKQLNDSNSKKDKLLNDLKHEIITPINAIMGHTSLVLELFKSMDNEYKRLKLKDILSEANRLVDIFKDIEALTEIKPIQPTPVLLFDIINKHAAIFNKSFTEQGIKLYVKNKDFPIMSLDITKFEIIISNILRNILKYSYVNTEASIIGATGDNFSLFIDFINYGMGIPINEEKIIFEEGVRSSNILASDPPIPGSGIGLHLVKLFLQQHKSHIAVIKNNNPTIIRISLSRSLIYKENRK